MTFLTLAALILEGMVLILLVLHIFSSKDIFKHLTSGALLGSGILLLGTLVYRSIKIEFWALTNTFESLVFFSCAIVLILFVLNVKFPSPYNRPITFGGTLTALVLLALSSSPLAPSQIKPPIPALQSGWLVLHVSFAFIGEAFFVVAFVASLVYLLTGNKERKEAMDKLTYKAIALGYPVFTSGAIIFGAVWAYYAWGRFWGWDPKETWALITWLTYTVYLHLRFIAKMDKRVTAWISIIGFAFTLFTFFGVNFLLSGLHSYR